MSLNRPILEFKRIIYFILITSVTISCTTLSSKDSIVNEVSIVYEPNTKWLVDHNFWYDEVDVWLSDTSFMINDYLIYFMQNNDTILCESDINYASFFKRNGRNFHFIFRNNKFHENSHDYYIKNSQRYSNFSLLIEAQDTSFSIYPSTEFKIKYIYNDFELNLETDRNLIDTMSYFTW